LSTIETVPARLGKLYREIAQLTPAELQAFLFVADNEGASQRQVSESLAMPQPTASRAITGLKPAGHDLIQAAKTGRQRALSLSPKGKQLLARLAVLLGCFCAAPAASAILCQFEVEASPENYSHAYDPCQDPRVFTCDVS
jgi:DNA-binding MarR family transcriptional regulator